jgi:Na+-transporting NADH:ubiquinone oxidoreductase subunit F
MESTIDPKPLPPIERDYSLVGVNAALAIERGLAEADWYQSPVPRDELRKLLARSDGPAIRDTILWFTLILLSGYATCRLWGTGWVILPYFIYSVLYATTSDSRWHESGHGTAFRSDWMNNALYEVSSFMVMRESIVWRWSHTRHHSDTIIVGRDPEIAAPRPTNVKSFILSFFGIPSYSKYFQHILVHAVGRMREEEKTFIPTTEFPKVYLRARIYLAFYFAVIVCALLQRSLLPLMLVGFVNLFGTWLMVVYGFTQHAGLAENVLDHRLNCRTVYMNPVNRFLYWNMNYHVEHHMYPLVPYHALPALHELVKSDCGSPYRSLFHAWSEIIPAIRRQISDPGFHIKRTLPRRAIQTQRTGVNAKTKPDQEGWLTVCNASELHAADALRLDFGKRTFAIYRNEVGRLYATDGICTHGNTHLAAGLVKGDMIECPKHNGRFHLEDGSPARPPVCRALATYPVEERDGQIYVNVDRAGGAGARRQQVHTFRVLSNDNVSTFVKELILEPIHRNARMVFEPGDYLQLDIPSYPEIHFSDFEVSEPYASVWREQHVFDLVSRNPISGRRNNYSLASNQASEKTLRFNVRIATPPPGQDCAPGVGSSYVFSLKPGDTVTGIGPFGDFHIKPTQREMVYIGGGAGMAPLRAHLSHLLETERTGRKVSFWYGARSRQELFYEAFFSDLARTNSNFQFHTVLSSPLPQDEWKGHEGFIHEVVLHSYLLRHPSPTNVEYYLCGPPMMIRATQRMLSELGVPADHISFDEF